MKNQHTPHHFLVDTVVIGGGLTGLVTAFLLRKSGQNIVILERDESIGGVIRTAREDGFTYDMGPSTGFISNQETMDLFAKLGMQCPLENASPHSRKCLILKNGRWRRLGFSLWGIVSTTLLSMADKLALLGEVQKPKGHNPYESFAEFVSRRFGQGALDYIVNPLMGYMYACNPAQVCTRFMFPRLHGLEQEDKSVLRSYVRQLFGRDKVKPDNSLLRFFSVKGGVGKLPLALAEHIGEENIYCNCAPLHVNPVDGGYEIMGQRSGNAFLVKCNHLVMTIGTHGVPALLPFLSSSDREAFLTMPYAPIVQVTLGFKRWKGLKIEGFGALVPEVENVPILSILFQSALFRDRAPRGGALLSVYLAGMRNPEHFDLSDEQIMALVETHLPPLLGLQEFKPDMVNITRHKKAVAQYTQSHGIREEVVQSIEKIHPNLYIGGNGFGGTSIADRIAQGFELAAKIKK